MTSPTRWHDDRSGLRLAIDESLDFVQDLPPVLQAAVQRLRERAETEPQLAERALHHLYQLVQGQA